MQYGGTSMSDGAMMPTYQAGHSPFAEKRPFESGQFYLNGARKRLNGVAIAIALFVPWGIFVAAMSILDFKLHYTQPTVSYVLFLIPVLITLGLLAQAATAVKKKETDKYYQPNWYGFLAITSAIALALGTYVGQSNFEDHFQNYYDLLNLGTYKEVDTTLKTGQQLMDAGRISFVNGTQLFLGRSMGFKDKDMYCVAPIVPSKVVADPTLMNGKVWDFWAVGKDCCSGIYADFHCPLFSSSEASGGLRVMGDADRAHYRLAVQQAEASYKIYSAKPLFFYWTRDPIEGTEDYMRLGYKNYVMAVCFSFLVQAFLVVVAMLGFSKLVHY